jgi:hypothetical protein
MTATLESQPTQQDHPDVVDTSPLPRGRWQRRWKGPAENPRWARPALFALLGMTAALSLVNLTASGWANAF